VTAENSRAHASATTHAESSGASTVRSHPAAAHSSASERLPCRQARNICKCQPSIMVTMMMKMKTMMIIIVFSPKVV